jgi:hypothetical protein
MAKVAQYSLDCWPSYSLNFDCQRDISFGISFFLNMSQGSGRSLYNFRIIIISVADLFLGVLDPDPFVRGTDPDPSVISQK